MISPDGWFDWAVKDPGPLDRWTYFDEGRTPMDAIYHHSMEGWFNSVASDGYTVLTAPDRFPTAWHWTVTMSGEVYQHYPVFARLQHANGGNIIGPGGETEGLFNMPLNEAQIKTWRRIHADIVAFTRKDYQRLPGNGRVGLCEHREAPGAQTACPSNRYQPLWREDVADEARIKTLIDERLIHFNLVAPDLAVGPQDDVASLDKWAGEHVDALEKALADHLKYHQQQGGGLKPQHHHSGGQSGPAVWED